MRYVQTPPRLSLIAPGRLLRDTLGCLRRARYACIATLLALLGLFLIATAGAQGPPANEVPPVVGDYLLSLESWSAANPEAPRQLAALEQRLLGSRAATPPGGRGATARVRCLAELDALVLEGVSELEPEGLLPLTSFYLEVFIAHATAGQRWLASEANGRYTSVLKRYAVRSKPRAETRRRHSQTLVAITARLSGQGLLALNEMARNAARRAVSLTPRSWAALYWAAFLEEKLGRHEEALDLLAQLLEHHGDDPEIRLRRGVNLARRGRTGAARADFESVARGAGDDVWRILAYQELAQLDPKAGAPRAVAILDEALDVFPDDQGLRLLASFHGQPVDPFSEGADAISPRLRYEMIREDRLRAADRAWMIEVESRLGVLSSAMAGIRGRVESAERTLKPCRGVELP